MIPAGLVNALYQWAKGDEENIASLVAERDAVVAAMLSGGKASLTINSGSVNGKTFGGLVNLSREDKLTLLTAVLERLGEIVAEPEITFADFQTLVR